MSRTIAKCNKYETLFEIESYKNFIWCGRYFKLIFIFSCSSVLIVIIRPYVKVKRIDDNYFNYVIIHVYIYILKSHIY